MNKYSPYLDWIYSQETTLLNRVREWVAIDSFSLDTQGLDSLASSLHSTFLSLGSVSSFHTLAPIKRLNPEGQWLTHPLGKALLFKKRAEAPIQVLLAGHFDTVYPRSNIPPKVEELSQGIGKGPGIADMKGGIAILLTALEALERSPFAETIGWEVLLTPDEEIGSPSSTPLYLMAAKRNDFGLVFEPSFPDGAFVNQRKGSATYTIVTRGQSAHVGRDFDKGKSALFPLVHFIHQLESKHIREELTLNIAELECKSPVNVVPPLASCRINFRGFNQIALANTEKALRALAKESEREGVSFEIIQETFRAPKPFCKRTEALFLSYAHCASDLQIPFHMRSTGGVCDGNILGGAGLPTLDTAGAVGGALHTPDEYLIYSSLVERARLTALFLFKLATGEIRKESFQ